MSKLTTATAGFRWIFFEYHGGCTMMFWINPCENPPRNATLPPSTKNKIAAFRLQWICPISSGIHQFRCVQIFPHRSSGDPLTDLTCGWVVQVCGATFGERICSQPQWSCYALPFSSTCSASTGHRNLRRQMLVSVHFVRMFFLVLCKMLCVFEDFMCESSFENVIIWNRQHMSHVTCFVLWLFFLNRPVWFKPHHTCLKFIFYRCTPWFILARVFLEVAFRPVLFHRHSWDWYINISTKCR